jgi:ferric iron reductase protein FhuF
VVTASATRRADRLLADPEAVDELVRAYGRRLGAPSRPVAAALAFKAYSYDVLEPVVTAWATRRRVPDLSAPNCLVRTTRRGYAVRPVVERLAVLADDPLAGAPGVTVLADEPRLLAELRRTLIDGHLAVAVEAFRAVRGGGARPLWGSVAQSLCYPVTVAGGLRPFEDVAALLSVLEPSVAALVEVAQVTERGRSRPVLLRRTCCYAYALPGGELCSSCCLATDQERARAFAARGQRLQLLDVPRAGHSRAG